MCNISKKQIAGILPAFLISLSLILFPVIRYGQISAAQKQGSSQNKNRTGFVRAAIEIEKDCYNAITELIKGIDDTKIVGGTYFIGSSIYVAKEYFEDLSKDIVSMDAFNSKSKSVKNLLNKAVHQYIKSIDLDLSGYKQPAGDEGHGDTFKKADAARELADRYLTDAMTDLEDVMKGNFENKEIEYVRSRKRAYSRANAWYKLAYDQKDISRKIEYYKKAVDIDPKFCDALVSLGVSYLINGESKRAVDTLRKALDLSPRDAEIWSNLGLAYELKKDYVKSIEAHKKAIEIEPANPKRLFRLAVAYANNGQDAKAVEVCSKALKLKPESDLGLEIVNFTLNYYETKKRYSEAIDLYLRESPGLKQDLGIKYKAARIYGKKGESDKALKLCEELKEADYPRKGWIYFLTGLIKWKVYSLDEAIMDMKEATQEAIQHFSAHSMLAYLYGIQGNHQGAIQEFENLFRMQMMGLADVSDPELTVIDIIPDIKMRTEEHAEFVQSAEAGKGDNFKDAYEGLLHLTYTKDLDKAAELFKKVRKKVKAANLFLGMVYEELNDIPDAVKSYKAYLSDEGDPLFKERMKLYISSL